MLYGQWRLNSIGVRNLSEINGIDDALKELIELVNRRLFVAVSLCFLTCFCEQTADN